MNLPIVPEFLTNPSLQAARPVVHGEVPANTEILAAKMFEQTYLKASNDLATITHEELQAWRLYVIDLEHCKCENNNLVATIPG